MDYMYLIQVYAHLWAETVTIAQADGKDISNPYTLPTL